MKSSGAEWTPRASLERIRARAGLLVKIRAFFRARGVLEVETPVLSRSATTDPALDSFHVGDLDHPHYLQTSPEFPMKRLLAAGSGDIYQIARVFRDGECGRWHNPEFTLLEWYRVGYDHWQLMNEVEALVTEVLPGCGSDFPRVSYADLFLEHLDIDPLVADVPQLAEVAKRAGVVASGELTRTGWLDLLFTHLIEPPLAEYKAVFVYGFCADQAALARLDDNDRRTASRFELYASGVELANGFHELIDPVEQRARFIGDNRLRRSQGREEMPLDELFLDALAEGLPDCSGVAMGVDRLLMLVTGALTIEEVLAFPIANA